MLVQEGSGGNMMVTIMLLQRIRGFFKNVPRGHCDSGASREPMTPSVDLPAPPNCYKQQKSPLLVLRQNIVHLLDPAQLKYALLEKYCQLYLKEGIWKRVLCSGNKIGKRFLFLVSYRLGPYLHVYEERSY